MLKSDRIDVDALVVVRRVSAGRLRLWQEAWRVVVDTRGDLLRLIPMVLAFLILLNLPWWPTYEKGLLTGAFIVATLWMISWVVWVMSGLGYRLNGVMAEDATNEVCRKHRNTLAMLPSYKLPTFDIDTVLVTRAAVYAVETKWRYREPPERDLRRDLYRLHRDVCAFRAELEGEGVPPQWIRGVLVVRGPGGRGLSTRLVDVARGERIRIVNSAQLPTWLDGQEDGIGMVGPDFASDLVRRLRDSNQEREERLEAGPVMRWLARTR